MPTLAQIRSLVKNTIENFSSESMSFYRVEDVAQSVYGRGAVSYEDPVTVKCTIITNFDQDKMTNIGALNSDERIFVVSVDEAIAKFPSVTDVWKIFRKEDAIKHENRKYGVTEIRLEGRVFGGATTVHIRCRENPSLVLP